MIICMSFTPNSIGGEYNHVLTESEMPKHKHNEYLFVKGYPEWRQITTNDYGVIVDCNSSSYVNPNQQLNATVANTFAKTETVGNDTAHNNVQPYIVTYFWKRVN